MSHRSRRSPLRAVVVALCAAAAVAGLTLIAPSARADGPRTSPVGPGDQLDISVLGDGNLTRALSGRFRVEKDGSFFYPILGRIEVAQMSPVDIADMLREELGAQVPIILTTVTIAEFAPVYLTGETARTGPFSFMPGMTVFDLVLDAGGFAGGGPTGERLARLTEELDRLELDRFALDVRKARLAAELEGRAFETAPYADGAPPGGAAVVAAEAAIFAAHKRALASRRSTYEAQKAGYDQEITAVEKSIALHDQEVALIEEQLGARETLAKRGFAASSSLSEMKRLLTAARRDALDFRTALFRARQNRLAADRDHAERQIELDARNVEQLREVELAIGQNAIALTAARDLMGRHRADASATRDALGRVPDYILIRRSGGALETTTVDETTPLQRGDVIRVTFNRDETTGAIPQPPALVTDLESAETTQ